MGRTDVRGGKQVKGPLETKRTGEMRLCRRGTFLGHLPNACRRDGVGRRAPVYSLTSENTQPSRIFCAISP